MHIEKQQTSDARYCCSKKQMVKTRGSQVQACKIVLKNVWF